MGIARGSKDLAAGIPRRIVVYACTSCAILPGLQGKPQA